MIQSGHLLKKHVMEVLAVTLIVKAVQLTSLLPVEYVHAQEVASILKLMENVTFAETTSKKQEKIAKELTVKTAKHVLRDILLTLLEFASKMLCLKQ